MGRVLRSPSALVGLTLMFLFSLMALLAPFISPHDPTRQDLQAITRPPGSEGHPLGTDRLGRDILSRIYHGARLSLWLP
ncbi:MAG: hypothetical protein NZL94_02610 [Meiothermus sp.]|uniref:hypothetical protein n=1 Tax=Meiothermus sp. TaxID=1955249 RepID=UPI0025F44BCD|nr:hypothetical protein [Meiothermus sp.]MCS7057759.1 hypothetical protein [Meiothermus sp.]